MRFPEMSYLQILIIEGIGGGRVAGRQIREHLKQNGVSKTGPAFYELMSRLENSGFVQGEIEQKVIDGQDVTERFYRVTSKGANAALETVGFFGNLNLKCPCFKRHGQNKTARIRSTRSRMLSFSRSRKTNAFRLSA